MHCTVPRLHLLRTGPSQTYSLFCGQAKFLRCFAVWKQGLNHHTEAHFIVYFQLNKYHWYLDRSLERIKNAVWKSICRKRWSANCCLLRKTHDCVHFLTSVPCNFTASLTERLIPREIMCTFIIQHISNLMIQQMEISFFMSVSSSCEFI